MYVYGRVSVHMHTRSSEESCLCQLGVEAGVKVNLLFDTCSLSLTMPRMPAATVLHPCLTGNAMV